MDQTVLHVWKEFSGLASIAACLMLTGCAISPPLEGREIIVDESAPVRTTEGESATYPDAACEPAKLGHFARFRGACRKHFSFVHITWDPVDQPPAPHPRFHPVPTRPVFAPQGEILPAPMAHAAPPAVLHAAPVEPAVEPARPAIKSTEPAEPAAPAADEHATTDQSADVQGRASKPSLVNPTLPVSSKPAATPSSSRLTEPNALPAVDDPATTRQVPLPTAADAPTNVWMPRGAAMRR